MRRLRKHVPNNEHTTIEWSPVLGNRPVNTHHSNECATIGCKLLGNAWVDTPDNNTCYVLLNSDVFSGVCPCRAYIWSSEDCSKFDRKTLLREKTRAEVRSEIRERRKRRTDKSLRVA
jgi:hypothetical protein